MTSNEVINILIGDLHFTYDDTKKIKIFVDELIIYNKKYNLIGTSTLLDVWSRHVLDSAQLVKFIKFDGNLGLADLGTGGGLPGIILAIFNKNINFHVKLYEKSPVKCNFLVNIINKIQINAEVLEGDYLKSKIKSYYITCRAFKKFPELLRVSREKINKPHKMIIMKGKNAQEDINYASKSYSFKYRLENSITDSESKIIILRVN